MNKNKLIITFLAAFIFTALFSIGIAQETTELNHGLIGRALFYEVSAPAEVSVGEPMTVKFSFKAEYSLIPLESLNVKVVGAGINHTKTLVIDVSVSEDTWITETFELTPISEGVVSCEIIADYVFEYRGRWTYGWGDINFDVTKVRSTTYEELVEDRNALADELNELTDDYQSLDSDYNSLLEDHTVLQNSYDITFDENQNLKSDLSTTRTAMYVLIIITAVFVVTTIYFARSKLKF